MGLVEEIRAELAKRIDPEYREGSRSFFKEAIDPWGVRSAPLKEVEVLAHRLVKPLPVPERYAVFEEWWRGGKFEEGVMVSHLARKFKREFGLKEFKIFERWIDQHVRGTGRIATGSHPGCCRLVSTTTLHYAKSCCRGRGRRIVGSAALRP